MLINPKRIVVISPHPDDEVLGLGATISRFSDMNIEVSILIVSGHLPPLYDQKLFNITKSIGTSVPRILPWLSTVK